MHPLVALAKQAVETYINNGKMIPIPEKMDETFTHEKSGVFVCLKIDKQLRGCIGTFMPVTENVAEETIRNAVAAATEDPRFSAVSREELGSIEYTVDVLSPPEEVHDLKELDPKKYGIIVIKDNRKGLLLPDLEGVESVDQQIHIASLKAGIISREGLKIFRFSVARYH